MQPSHDDAPRTFSQEKENTDEPLARRVRRIFALQRAHAPQAARSTAAERRAKLRRLLDTLLAHRQRIREALHADFAKPPAEVDLTEIYAVTSEIKHARRYLRRWMRGERARVPLNQFGSRAWIRYEPKGTVLILSPWNFPVNLTLGPLVSAIAAGNTAILKPSEFAPHAAAAMRAIVEEVFAEPEVAVVEGDATAAAALLAEPFNHIFFTGSPAVGRQVMAAAAEHLASVTLELGGKSPTIVDETADIAAAARRIAWAKFLNSGQICIAPDYCYVHHSKCDELLAEMRSALRDFYGGDAGQSPAYCRIVNARHYQRLRGLLHDALDRKASIYCGGETREEDRYIGPTILRDVPPDARVLQEEIFGPLLPVLSYEDLAEPIAAIASRPPPLALYLYSRDRRHVERVLAATHAGGTCINHSGLHFFNPHLPFGGLNHSGIGRSHGRFGFQAFSNPRAMYRQSLPWSPIDRLMPPYTPLKQKLIDATLRWF